jgi:hypothetical protein
MNSPLAVPSPDNTRDSHDLEILLKGLKGVPVWDVPLVNMLDYLYRHRLLMLLSGQVGGAHLRAYRDHLDLLLDDLADSQPAVNSTVAGRWAIYRDLAGSQLAANRRPAPDSLLRKTHVRDILERVLDGRVRTQRDIQLQLKLKEANASRILKLMEQSQLIRRRRVGRENEIEAGAAADTAGIGRRTAPRGLDYLTVRG